MPSLHGLSQHIIGVSIGFGGSSVRCCSATADLLREVLWLDALIALADRPDDVVREDLAELDGGRSKSVPTGRERDAEGSVMMERAAAAPASTGVGGSTDVGGRGAAGCCCV